jgi:hypothetical protein
MVRQPIEVKRMNNLNATARKFNDVDDMCSCTKSVSLVIQCGYKIALREKFHLYDFNYRHHFRDQCMGFDIFPNITNVIEQSIDINQSEFSIGNPKLCQCSIHLVETQCNNLTH